MSPLQPGTMPCPRCKGSGTQPLTPWLQEVYDLIRLSGKTPGYIADKLGITDQAANNRLKKLMDAGLLERKPVRLPGGGLSYNYRRTIP